MTIQFKELDKIKDIFVKELQRQRIRITNIDNIEMFLQDRISKLKKQRKNSITEKVIKTNWLYYFDSQYNSRLTHQLDMRRNLEDT